MTSFPGPLLMAVLAACSVAGTLPAAVFHRVTGEGRHEYDERLRFVLQHVIPSGPTRLGIQTTAFASGRRWFSC